LQLLFKSDRKKCFSEILEGSSKEKCPVDPKVAHKYFAEKATGFKSRKNVFSKPDWFDKIESMRPRTCTEYENTGTPLTLDEFSEHVKHLSSSTPGWDGISNTLIKHCPPIQNWLFNIAQLVFHFHYIPNCWKQGHTILLDKGDADKNNLDGWRPICLQSALYKVVAGLCSKRLMNHHFKLLKENGNGIFSPGQRGFVQGVEGCVTQSFLLQSVHQHAIVHKKSFYSMWLDFANAFGSVDHQLIKFSTEWCNIPLYLQDIASSLYTDNTFQVCTGPEQKWTDPILLECGVAQGCPFSPNLFNLCLEPLFRYLQLHSNEIGFRLSSPLPSPVSISSLAYADDINVISDSIPGLQAQANIVTTFCDWTGMVIKHKKCSVVASVYNNSGVRQFIDPNIIVQRKVIPVLSSTDSYKYLGIPTDRGFNFKQLRKKISSLLHSLLKKINSCPLRPFQKVIVLKEAVIPKILFLLSSVDVGEKFLSGKDSGIRNQVRSWLGLPNGSPIGQLHGAGTSGGLNIPSLVDRSKAQRTATALKLIACAESTARSIATIAYTDSILETRRLIGANLIPSVPVLLRSDCVPPPLSSQSPSQWSESFQYLQNSYEKSHEEDKNSVATQVAKKALLIWNCHVKWKFWPTIMSTLKECDISIAPIRDHGRSSWQYHHHAKENPIPILPRDLLRHMSSLSRNAHIQQWKTLPMAGASLRIDPCTAVGPLHHASYAAIKQPYLLTDREYSFYLQAHGGVLPVKTNLARWSKNPKPSPYCNRPGCRRAKDTQCHRLNNCKSRLSLYAKRHNALLSIIAQRCVEISNVPLSSIATSPLSPGRPGAEKKPPRRPDQFCHPQFYALWDKPCDPTVFGYAIAQRPDIQVYEDSSYSHKDQPLVKNAGLFDLKCPYHGPSFTGCDTRNKDKYEYLAQKLRSQSSPWRATVETIIVSSTGLIPTHTPEILKKYLPIPAKQISSLLIDLSICAIKESYSLFSK
jgi:hypothetical protein